MPSRRSFIIALVTVTGCHKPVERGATALSSGVSRADSGLAARDPRVIPLTDFPGDVQILLGDPDSAGPFVMRIHEPPGTIIPPHSHPVDENITVLQGTFWFGMGPQYDSVALRRLPAGGYAFAPAGTTMFGATPEDAIVQVSGIGPFKIRWINGATTLEDPGTTTFRFRAGERVLTPRGVGVIRQGYASGTLIEYEIADSSGRRFMAVEGTVKAAH
ncbi:MAG TPA: cupin domain-containing protein [Gemmatimonadales bacterium]|nr:cupin domain-containing protein [Gemmatimonadales bacterium]